MFLLPIRGRVKNPGLAFLPLAAVLGVFALGGCSLVPEEWREWLASSPDQEEEEYSYGWEDSEKEEAARREWAEKDRTDWAGQSWAQGAPVTYAPEPLTETDKGREPVGPVVNSPVRRLDRAESRIESLEVEMAGLRREIRSLIPAVRDLMAKGRQDASASAPVPAQQFPNEIAAAAPAAVPAPVEGESFPGSYMVPGGGMASPHREMARGLGGDAGEAAAPSAVVRNIRFGEHGTKVRLVLDLDRPAPYSYSTDAVSGNLVIDLSGVSWEGPLRGTLNKSPLFTHYTVQQVPGSGSRLVLHLRRPAKVVYADQLSPNETYRNHRIFLDVVPQ